MQFKTGKLSSLHQGYSIEQWVKQQLIQHGLCALFDNFKTPFGEIDLIMRERNEIAFIEVRYRNKDSYGEGSESVTIYKQRRIIRSAQFFLLKNNKYEDFPCRFDVVSVAGSAINLRMNWIRAAFEVE